MSINTSLGTQQYHGKRHPHSDHTFTGTGVALGCDGAGNPAEIDYSTSAVATTLALRDASGQVAVPLVPTGPSHAVSKQYFDSALVGGTTWKELLLHSNQLLSGGAGGVLQALLAYIATNPTANDTFIIYDGTVTETFTFKGALAVPFDVLIGATAADTLNNLITAINTDSALWSAILASGLDNYFAGVPAGQMVLYRTATSLNPDRVYGVLAGGQSGIKVVSFAGLTTQDYQSTSGIESDLPAADPAVKTFGFGRTFASLVGGMTHRINEDNSAYCWDADDQMWRQIDVGVLTGGNGIDITNNTIAVDLDATSGLEFNAAKLRAKTDETTIERGTGSLRVKDGGITLAKLADQKAEIALAGTAPVLADLASLTTAGHWAFAKGTGDQAYLCYALGATPKKFAVQLGEITT